MPRGPCLDALPPCVRTLRSRSSPGIYDRRPALRQAARNQGAFGCSATNKGRSVVREFGGSVVPRTQGTQATQRTQYRGIVAGHVVNYINSCSGPSMPRFAERSARRPRVPDSSQPPTGSSRPSNDSTTVKVLPRPSPSDSAQIRPPCSSTSFFVMDRPRPDPSWRLCRVVSS